MIPVWHNDALAVAIAGLRIEPKIFTAQLQRQLADYNAVRRLAVSSGCLVINEQSGDMRAIEVAPDAAGLAFVRQGGCTRTVLPHGAVLHRLVGGVRVMVVEVSQ